MGSSGRPCQRHLKIAPSARGATPPPPATTRSARDGRTDWHRRRAGASWADAERAQGVCADTRQHEKLRRGDAAGARHGLRARLDPTGAQHLDAGGVALVQQHPVTVAPDTMVRLGRMRPLSDRVGCADPEAVRCCAHRSPAVAAFRSGFGKSERRRSSLKASRPASRYWCCRPTATAVAVAVADEVAVCPAAHEAGQDTAEVPCGCPRRHSPRNTDIEPTIDAPEPPTSRPRQAVSGGLDPNARPVGPGMRAVMGGALVGSSACGWASRSG